MLTTVKKVEVKKGTVAPVVTYCMGLAFVWRIVANAT